MVHSGSFILSIYLYMFIMQPPAKVLSQKFPVTICNNNNDIYEQRSLK